MFPKDRLTVQRRTSSLLQAKYVGFELAWRMDPDLDVCGQGSADPEPTSESCQQALYCSALPTHFHTQPGSL